MDKKKHDRQNRNKHREINKKLLIMKVLYNKANETKNKKTLESLGDFVLEMFMPLDSPSPPKKPLPRRFLFTSEEIGNKRKIAKDGIDWN